MSDNLFRSMALDEDGLSVPVQAWFSLVSGFTVVERDLRTMLMESFDLSVPRFDVLTALAHARSGVSMSELAALLVVSKGNVTGVVRRLESDGYVVRGTARNDRRVQRVRLTPAGRRLWQRAFKAYQRVVAEKLDAMTERQLGVLIRQLAGITSQGTE